MVIPAASPCPTTFILNPKPTTTVLSSSPLHRHLWRTTTSNTNACFVAAARVPLVATDQIEEEEAAGDFIRRLQNGPDVRGVALDGEKGRAVELTPQAVEAIAECFGEWAAERKAESGSLVRVSVGRDPRVSGRSLSAAVFAGLRKGKCEVFDMGLATTPACFMSTVLSPFAYDASIMLTASHLPYTRNGLKFFTKEGGLSSGDVEQICDRAARKYTLSKIGRGRSCAPPPPTTSVDFMSAYAKHLRDIIIERISHPSHYHTPLRGFKIIVNAGNGCGGFFTWDVLEKLGADTTGSINLDPDGMFPNHIPNPEDPIAMSHTVAAVLRHGADLGVVFDTDVDRSGVVDRTGASLNGDRLIAIMSAIVLREHPGTTVVTDARTSVSLTRFITAAGGRHCLYRVGYRNVIDKGIQLNEDGLETHLMMETTGHGALKENYFLDDGAYMVVKIIIEMVRMRLAGSSEGIGSLIKDLEEPMESVELRMDVLAQPKHAREKAAEAVEAFRKCIQGDGQKKTHSVATTDNISSTVTSYSLIVFRKKIFFPNELVAIVAKKSDRARSPPPGFFTVSELTLRAGLRFPLAPELIEIFKKCGVALLQFSFRALMVIIGLTTFFRERGVILTIEYLCRMCRFTCDAQGRVSYRTIKNWIEFSARDPPKNLSNGFFYVKIEWGLPERWGRLNDLLDPSLISKDDILATLNIPDVGSLQHELHHISKYIVEDRMFKVGLSIQAGRSHALPLKRKGDESSPHTRRVFSRSPSRVPSLQENETRVEMATPDICGDVVHLASESLAISTHDGGVRYSKPQIPEEVLNHICAGRQRTDELVTQSLGLMAHLGVTLDEWNIKFVKIKYLRGEYDRRMTAKAKEVATLEDQLTECRTELANMSTSLSLQCQEVECAHDELIEVRAETRQKEKRIMGTCSR